MSRRTLKSCLWAAAVVAALGLATRSLAKPPDLPVNIDPTVTPAVLPDSEGDAVAPPPCPCRPTLPPFLARLSATQRQNFASTLLFGAHPLLSLVPTDRLVDLSCDHPACTSTQDDHAESHDARIILLGTGVNSDAGLKCEIVPLPDDVHGTIEIGIGFNLQGRPTYKFLVTEFSGRGNVHKDETFTGCMNTLIRALKRDCCDQPGPVEGGVEDQKGIAKPYRETNDAPAGVGKGE